MFDQIALYLEALSKVLPVILMILTGVALRRTSFISPTTVQESKKLVVNVTLPALLFLAFSGVDLQGQHLIVVALVFVACVLVLLLGFLLRPVAGAGSPYFPMLLTGFEAGMMGYAIFGAIYGADNIFKFGVVDLGQVTFVFFVMVTFLERYSSGARPLRDTVAGFLRTPVILAILAGVLFNQLGLTTLFRGWPVTDGLLEGVSLLGSLTVPLVTIAIGYEMTLRPGNLGRPAVTVGLRLAMWVTIGLLLNHFVITRLPGLEAGFQAAVLTMFILPPPFIIPLFMPQAARADRDYVLNTLTLATLATLFAVSLVSLLYPPT